MALNAVAALVLPSATTRFWDSTVLSGDDATVNAWCGNQSLNGVLHRFFGPAPWVFARVVVIAVLGGIAVALLVRRMVADGRGFSALLVTALYGTLISPIAWTHHWCGR